MKTPAKKKPGAKPGNTNAKGRAPKRPTYSVRIKGKSQCTTPYLPLAMSVAQTYFADQRSVNVYDNANRKTVALFIYGHRQ